MADSMKYTLSTLVLINIFVLCGLAFGAQPLPSDPIYMRIDHGWKGFYARNDEYLEYSIVGDKVKFQDAYHALIKPGLGFMVTFAEKKNFGADKDVLAAHRQWEVDYWRKNARKVEVADRSDLRGTRSDIMVTELRIYGTNADEVINIYQIAIASKDGVYVFAISPATQGIDEVVAAFIGSVTLVNKRFDVKKENDKIRREIDAGVKQ